LEGEAGTSINDGGAGMYNGGNVLNTNLASAIQYTNGIVTASDAMFGVGSRYATAKYPGLFVMIATDADISSFRISGFTGLFGDGTANGVVLPVSVAGAEYTVFLKRVFNGNKPSINHIIIVPGDGGSITHTFSTDTFRDSHAVDGLDGIRQIYYLLVSRQDGLKLDVGDVSAIARQFLGIVAHQADADNDGIGDVCDECGLLDCDDGDPCTNDRCDPLTGCSNREAPSDSCLLAGRARLVIDNAAEDAGDKISWRWRAGPQLQQGSLGAPNATTTYTLCLYDSNFSGTSLKARLDVPPSALWRSRPPSGWQYRDSAGAVDGIKQILLTARAVGGSKAGLKAAGASIPMPQPVGFGRFFDQDPRVTVQLVGSDADVCYRSDFTDAEKNEASQFKARAR
jgi:hypothetical protein